MSAYDFHAYLADMMLASQKARNTGQHSTADMIDGDLHFAITDAHSAGQIADHDELRESVAHKVIERGGHDLIDTLIPPKK